MPNFVLKKEGWIKRRRPDVGALVGKMIKNIGIVWDSFVRFAVCLIKE